MKPNYEFIAFIDLVGVKDAHTSSPFAYAEKITDFQSTLENQIATLEHGQEPGQDCQVFMFSDCAFIRSLNVENLIDYLRWVRHACYTSNRILFFKGAIVYGKLHAIESDTRSASLRGVTFSKDAVKVYLRHESSKAIGIVIDGDALGKLASKDRVVNFYYPSEKATICQTFYDLAHTLEAKSDSSDLNQNRSIGSGPVYQGINHDIATHCRNEFYRASLRSVKLARYYPPIFCNWIQSISMREIFKGNRINKSSKELLAENPMSPWAIYVIVCTKDFVKQFWTVPGVPLLYFVILNKLYSAFLLEPAKDGELKIKRNATFPKAVNEIHTFILKLSKLSKLLETVPPQILNPMFRDVYLNHLVRSEPE